MEGQRVLEEKVMSTDSLEKRVAALETQVSELKKRLQPTSGDDRPWWQKIYGAFEGSKSFKEAMDLGRKYRESLRPKPRKRKD